MKKTDVASRLVTIAEGLVEDKTTVTKASSTPKVRKAYDLGQEVKASAKQVAELASQFLDTHSDIISQMRDFEKKAKEQEDVLKAYYKDWKKDSGFEKARREMLAQAHQCLTVGEVLEDLSGDITVALRESGQIGYKEKFEILVSTLNEAEMRKYADAMKEYYRKQISELTTGLSQLDGQVKEWSKEAQDLAAERGIKLPKATDLGRIRKAAVLDDVKEILRSVIPNFIRRIREWGAALLSGLIGNRSTLDSVSRELLARAKKVQAIL